MGWACGTIGKRCTKSFRWEVVRETDHLEDLDVDGRIMFE
jgi:hypothetical protein